MRLTTRVVACALAATLATSAAPAAADCVRCHVIDFGFMAGKLAICRLAEHAGMFGDECVFVGDESCYTLGRCPVMTA